MPDTPMYYNLKTETCRGSPSQPSPRGEYDIDSVFSEQARQRRIGLFVAPPENCMQAEGFAEADSAARTCPLGL